MVPAATTVTRGEDGKFGFLIIDIPLIISDMSILRGERPYFPSNQENFKRGFAMPWRLAVNRKKIFYFSLWTMVAQMPATAYLQAASDPIPNDAKEVNYYLSTLYGDHLAVPAEFTVKSQTYKGWLIWDTGIRPNNCDIQITADFFHRLGFQPKNQRTALSSLAVGGPSSAQAVQFNYIANDGISDVGPIPIHLKLGSLEVGNLRLYTDPVIDRSSSDWYNRFDPRFKDGPGDRVLGNVTFPFMQKYLISIDYQNKKIYFRPLDAERRLFFTHPPLATIQCVITDGIFCPIDLNGRPEGYGLFDTGDPQDLFDSPVIRLSGWPFKSLRLGQYDVLKQEPGYKCSFRKKIGFFSRTKLDFAAIIGNDTFQGHFITIDPKLQKIYVER